MPGEVVAPVQAPPPSGSSGSARAALAAVVLWVVIEFFIRDLAGLGIAFALVRAEYIPRTAAVPEPVLIILYGMTGVALLVLGGVFYRRVQKEQLTWLDLGYDVSNRILIAGILSGAALFGVTEWGTGPLDERLSGVTHAMEERLFANEGTAAFAVLLPVNALLAPLVEEFAWRGYVQTRLVAVWGVTAGVVVTALLFAAKHVVGDLSIDRTVTLLAGALALGMVRQRWGTIASTLTHAVLNLVASLEFAVAILRG